MHLRLNRLSVLAGALMASLMASSGASAEPAVTTDDVNMRTGPGTGYAVVLTLPAGAPVDVQDCGDGWCRVIYRGRVGYVSQSYLDDDGDAVVGPPRVYVPPPVYVEPPFVYPPYYPGWRRPYPGWRPPHPGWRPPHPGWRPPPPRPPRPPVVVRPPGTPPPIVRPPGNPPPVMRPSGPRPDWGGGGSRPPVVRPMPDRPMPRIDRGPGGGQGPRQ